MHPNGFLKICNDAKSRIKEIESQELYDTITSDKLIYLIDVREKEELSTGLIPNAIHMAKGVIERDIEHHIPDKNATLIVYCSGGYRSALVADNLMKMGYRDVASLKGGLKGWINAGLPLNP